LIYDFDDTHEGSERNTFIGIIYGFDNVQGGSERNELLQSLGIEGEVVEDDGVGK
ncbi:hypothetical protein PanWU01x14_241270, partial [Parasponia andersonii]